MLVLILGLLIFLGVHCVGTIAPKFREAQISLRGEGTWKGGYSGISAFGLVLVIAGYWLAREEAVQIFDAPSWTRTFLIFCMPVALVLIAASQFPLGWIKRTTRHPMMIGVSIWSIGHLIANGDAASMTLFGGFAIWAIFYMRSAFAHSSAFTQPFSILPDIAALSVGLLFSWLFGYFLHHWLFGVVII